MKTLYLVDGHSHIYQSFYAIRGISGPHGEPVNAIYGLANTLMKLLRRSETEHMAIALDEKEQTFRSETYADYKAQRKPMPEDLVAQIEPIREMLALMGIPVVSVPGYEADDIIGTLAARAAAKGYRVFIVTRDKDFRQLLRPEIVLFDSKTEEIFDEKALMERFGLRPEQITDVFGLAGDTSDNIPGVPGIGPKTAAALVQQYGTLEDVLERAGEIKGKRGEMLRLHADDARMSKDLATIRCDAPVDVDVEQLRLVGFNRPELAEFFKRYGFRRLTAELDAATAAAAAPRKDHYRIVSSDDQLAELIRGLRSAGRFAVDTETTHKHPMLAELVGVSVSWEDGMAWYVPIMNGELDGARALCALKEVLEDPSIAKVGQNIKYDMLVLERAGVKLAGVDFDTMVAAYVLDPGGRRYGIDDLAEDLLGERKTPTSAVIGKGASATSMDKVDVRSVGEYACEDADVTWRLRNVLLPKLRETGLEDVFNRIEMPLIAVLAEMERNGVCIDVKRLEAMSEEIERELAELEKEIYAEAGERFNIASPKQLSDILFNKLALPRLKRTKEGYSTASDVLAALAPAHPIASLVLRYRRLAKLKGTYVDALQNIPIRTKNGARIREAFVPQSEDDVLLTADYSQIELRFLAHFSGDERLVDAYRRGEDIHSVVAAEIFRVPREEVTEELRSRAKAVDFGIIYGQGAYGLAQSTGLSIAEAQEYIDAFFERYTGVEDFIRGVLQGAIDRGYVETICGRRRYISGVKSAEEGRARTLPDRTAVNTVIQGSAADMIKLAMINIHRRIREENRPLRMIMQVHDELVFELPAGGVEEAMEMVRAEMSNALSLDVPVVVNCAWGRNWLAAK